jgi:hypothetical protein
MYFNNSKSYAIKDLADIAYSKVGLLTASTSINKLGTENETINRLAAPKSMMPLGTVLILAITFYVICTFLLYPNPLLIITFDSIIKTFI